MGKIKDQDILDTIHMPVGDPIEGRSLPIHVIPDEKMKECGVAMCCRKKDDPGMFSDNLEKLCEGGCGEVVIYRPYLPEEPMKICIQCVARMIENGVH